MKKTALLMVALMAFSLAACKKKEEAPKVEAPAAGAAGQMPADATHSGSNPHAGLKTQEIPAGIGHKGKVISTMDAAGYTYLEVEEKGQKIWVAVMQTPVKVGDIVEFPDSPPMLNFKSKSLKRTFDKIIFAPGLRIDKKG